MTPWRPGGYAGISKQTEYPKAKLGRKWFRYQCLGFAAALDYCLRIVVCKAEVMKKLIENLAEATDVRLGDLSGIGDPCPGSQVDIFSHLEPLTNHLTHVEAGQIGLDNKLIDPTSPFVEGLTELLHSAGFRLGSRWVDDSCYWNLGHDLLLVCGQCFNTDGKDRRRVEPKVLGSW